MERGFRIPRLLSCFRPSWFRVGVRTLTLQVWSCCGSVGSRVRSGRALLCLCVFFVFVLLYLVLSCSVWNCVPVKNTNCVFSRLSCFVWTHGLWVSLLAACSCPVLHMASDSVLLAMCLCFCFVWADSFSHSFCVPCALMSSIVIVLTPPLLFPDCWFVCPTCVTSLPSSFAPFIISLCLQSCASLSSKCCVCLVSCPTLPRLALPCPAPPCLALPCPALPCLALHCPAMPVCFPSLSSLPPTLTITMCTF